jgi:sporulation protein YlmC with PRC-barrel domain
MSSSQTNEQPVTMMESGSLATDKMVDSDASSGERRRAEVRRGMTVLTSEGHTAGHVAAVVLNSRNGKVTHLVLGRLKQTTEYRLAPVDLVAAVGDGEVLLRIYHPLVESLPMWHGSDALSEQVGGNL